MKKGNSEFSRCCSNTQKKYIANGLVVRENTICQPINQISEYGNFKNQSKLSQQYMRANTHSI